MPNYNPQKTTNREKENKNERYLQDRSWGASRNENKQWAMGHCQPRAGSLNQPLLLYLFLFLIADGYGNSLTQKDWNQSTF
jgi:hypothetical protein